MDYGKEAREHYTEAMKMAGEHGFSVPGVASRLEATKVAALLGILEAQKARVEASYGRGFF